MWITCLPLEWKKELYSPVKWDNQCLITSDNLKKKKKAFTESTFLKDTKNIFDAKLGACIFMSEITLNSF